MYVLMELATQSVSRSIVYINIVLYSPNFTFTQSAQIFSIDGLKRTATTMKDGLRYCRDTLEISRPRVT